MFPPASYARGGDLASEMLSIEQARAILGSDYDVISDETIQLLIKLFEQISYVMIEKELKD